MNRYYAMHATFSFKISSLYMPGSLVQLRERSKIFIYLFNSKKGTNSIGHKSFSVKLSKCHFAQLLSCEIKFSVIHAGN